MKSLYTVTSWVYNSFNNYKYGWQYDLYWEHDTPDVLNIIDRQRTYLLSKKEDIDKDLIEMHIIIKKEMYDDCNTSPFPDSVETLFSTLKGS